MRTEAIQRLVFYDFLKDYGKKVTQMENFNKNFTRFMVLQ